MSTGLSLESLDGLRVEETIEHPPPLSRRGDPTWEVAYFYPRQGEWEEDDYLSLGTNQMIDFDDGCIEVLPMPKISHQLIVQWLIEQLKTFIASRKRGGVVLSAPLPVQLWRSKYRQPDIVYLAEDRWRKTGDYPDGADLVIEVVSESAADRERDYETKRAEYARAGISEYWIVDPQEERITVLTLDGDEYRVHGEFRPGEDAASLLLDGFRLPVADVFRAAGGPETAGA